VQFNCIRRALRVRQHNALADIIFVSESQRYGRGGLLEGRGDHAARPPKTSRQPDEQKRMRWVSGGTPIIRLQICFESFPRAPIGFIPHGVALRHTISGRCISGDLMLMLIEALNISGVIKIAPKRFVDARGSFSEVFRSDVFRSKVADVEFVQHNQSVSVLPGTVRGLHFQSEPRAQGKLVRCLRGSIFDVAVDLRRSSSTFGRHATTSLTADGGEQLWIPVGFAHGFCTLEPDTEVH
jgi:dTDP-4-dehydrorhamnose 3,5-epimerase